MPGQGAGQFVARVAGGVVIRIGDLLENDRELVTGVADIYLSTSSNRLNVVMKQLSVIATVFLPRVSRSASSGRTSGGSLALSAAPPNPVVLGMEVVSVGLMVVLFKKRDWL